jgi:hypothetical protein
MLQKLLVFESHQELKILEMIQEPDTSATSVAGS